MVDTRTKDVDLDLWMAQVNGAGAYGNGKGVRLGVGQNNVNSPDLWQQRSALRIPMGSPTTAGSLFFGIPSSDRITSFRLYVRVDNDCGGKGSTIRMFAERGTTTFTEGSYAVQCGLTTSAASSAEWPGPTRTSTSRGTYSGDPAAGAWIFFDLTDMAKAAFDAGLTELVVVLLAANAGLTDYDEETTARRIRLYSSQSPSKPYGQLQWTDNEPPTAPIDMAGSGASVAGTTASFTFRHQDPEGDAASKYQVQWGTVEAFTSGIVKDETITAAIAQGALKTHNFSGLPARTTGWARARTFDGQWGAWGAAFSLDTHYKPTAVNLAVEPGTLTPELSASILSGDAGDYITAVEEIVYQDLAGADSITRWGSGKQAIAGTSTRSALEYAGDALVPGTQYRRAMRLWNRDNIPSDADGAPLTATQLFTQTEPLGGRIRIGAAGGPLFDVTTKIDDLTPDLYVDNPAGGNIDQARLRIWNEAETTVLYDTGPVTFASAANHAFTIPAGILTAGMNPRADAAVRVAGNPNIGPYSELAAGHVNATPGTPSPVTISGGQTVQGDAGVWVTTDPTPTATFPFRDTDKDLGYDETPEWQQVEVRELDDDHFAASPYTDATDPAETFDLPALTVENTYKTRAKYRDTAAAEGGFSDYAFVKYSAAPTLTGVTPADASTLEDPTPTVDGTYGHTGAVAEEARRLRILEGETTLYDTGFVEPGPIAVPAFILPNLATIDLELTSRNEDGLTVTVTNTVDTDFATPDPITGLTITQDDAEMALLVEWDPSDDVAFEAYYVDARSAGGQFRRVAEITDASSTAILYRAAGHNVDTVIRVSQTNGWATSEPAEETATLEADGYWLKRP